MLALLLIIMVLPLVLTVSLHYLIIIHHCLQLIVQAVHLLVLTDLQILSVLPSHLPITANPLMALPVNRLIIDLLSH